MCDVRSVYICRECGGVVIACSWYMHVCIHVEIPFQHQESFVMFPHLML